MSIFFTADTHFGDRHILRQRGTFFDTIEAHDEALIARWNAVVGRDDEIWHLGDVAGDIDRAACAELFARLNGRKHLVRGNHDTNRILDLPWAKPPVDALRLTVRDAEGREHKLFFSHYPHRSWPGIWRQTRHLYGHTHAKLADTRRSCDVGVDAWDFSPVGWTRCSSARTKRRRGRRSSGISRMPKPSAESEVIAVPPLPLVGRGGGGGRAVLLRRSRSTP